MGPKVVFFNGFSICWLRVIAKWYGRISVHTNFSRRISSEWFWKTLFDGSLRKATSKNKTPNPTRPRRFRKSNDMAFPFNVMAFPVTGRSHGLAAAPGHGQVALGTKKVARPWRARNWGPAPLSRLSTVPRVKKRAMF